MCAIIAPIKIGICLHRDRYCQISITQLFVIMEQLKHNEESIPLILKSSCGGISSREPFPSSFLSAPLPLRAYELNSILPLSALNMSYYAYISHPSSLNLHKIDSTITR